MSRRAAKVEFRRLGPDGRIVIPKKILKALSLSEGDYLAFELTATGLHLSPARAGGA